MRTSIGTFLVLAALGVAFAGDAPAGPFTGRIQDRSRICMMQDNLQPKPGLAYDYQGKTYWLCCQMCEKSFSADPERFAHAKDPVNGAVVDKATAPTYAVDDRAFYFSSDKTLETFAKDPTRFLHGG
jgi:YHS domain-containing protein